MIPIPGGMTTILGGVLLIAVGTYYLHCESVKKDRAQFIAKLEAQAEAQKKEIDRITNENQARKEKADADTKKLRAQLFDSAKRLRDHNASASVLPPARTAAGGPARTCFDHAALERAIQDFIAGTSELVIQGDQARLSLDIAKEWARVR